ncbi:MAG: ISPpu10, transposase [Herminiimonas sp.]|nr:ISPpu10, transposase [Herminiimonas sp.]
MQSPLFIGVDVAKAEVVAACSQMSFPVRKVANTVPELKKLLKCLPVGSCIAMEVTGIYHRTLADLAHRAGFKVYVLNPKDMRHYAKGVGMRAKTDRVDSLVIARFLAHEIKQLRAYEPPTPTQRAIDELLKRRATLVAHKTAIQLTCSQMTVLKKRAAKLTAGFDEILQFISAPSKPNAWKQ